MAALFILVRPFGVIMKIPDYPWIQCLSSGPQNIQELKQEILQLYS